MTVVCSDGRVIAGDSRITCKGEIISDDFEKVFGLPCGAVAGISGDIAGTMIIRRWLEAGMDPARKPAMPPGEEAEALVLHADGRLVWLDQAFEPIPYSAPFGIGAGGTAAVVAMNMGAIPSRACEQACLVHSTCGGRIRTLKPTKGKRQ